MDVQSQEPRVGSEVRHVELPELPFESAPTWFGGISPADEVCRHGLRSAL